MTSTSARDSSPHATFKFPTFQPDLLPTPEEDDYGLGTSRGGSPNHGHGHVAQGNGSAIPADRWQPRRGSKVGLANGVGQGAPGRHGRQKSLSEAIRTIRTRKGSVTQNAQEIAEALKAPLSPKLVVRAHNYWRPGARSADPCSCFAESGT